MKYYIKFNEENKPIGYMEYPYENQTMTEVSQQDYYNIRHENGADDTEQIRKIYEDRTVELIRQAYSPNEENKVIREFLAEGEPKREQFDNYNQFVLDCKNRAKTEIMERFPFIIL